MSKPSFNFPLKGLQSKLISRSQASPNLPSNSANSSLDTPTLTFLRCFLRHIKTFSAVHNRIKFCVKSQMNFGKNNNLWKFYAEKAVIFVNTVIFRKGMWCIKVHFYEIWEIWVCNQLFDFFHLILNTFRQSCATERGNRYKWLYIYWFPWGWGTHRETLNKSIGHMQCVRWLFHFFNAFIWPQNKYSGQCNLLCVVTSLCNELQPL